MAECYTPYITMHNGKEQPVPCNRCPNCTARRISAWSFRLMQEQKRSTSAYFITLTYDNDHVPITKNRFMTLKKEDVQKWFKKLRKDQWNSGNVTPLKYYLAGEYGDKFKRPHYHIILFNLDLKHFIGEKLHTQVKMGNILLDGKHNFQNKQWQHGHVTIGEVNEASVGYTLIYLHKAWRPLHINDDRQPQFSLMSKKLGLNYLSEKMVKWYEQDLRERMYCNIEDGKKIAMPRYYKQKLYLMIFKDQEEAEHHLQLTGKYQLQKMQNKKNQLLLQVTDWDKFHHQQDARKYAAFVKHNNKAKDASKNF